jgi:sigma-B regulation protein RsbU (phosphoserine phosphatase)
LVAGIMENAPYVTDCLQLVPGQSVFLYTDGVTEAMNPREAFYTEERLLAKLRERVWDNPRTLVDILRADIAAFVQEAPQADDITMLALRYCGAMTPRSA